MTPLGVIRAQARPVPVTHAIWKTTVLAQLERSCQELGCLERVAKLDVMIWLHQRSSEGGSVYLLVVLCITKSGLIYPLTNISMISRL